MKARQQGRACVTCNSHTAVKIGKRRNKFASIQRYKCSLCRKTFSNSEQNHLKNKSYPVKIILNAVSHYNFGHTQSEVAKCISRKHTIPVPQKTISNWLSEYKSICSFSRLRKQAIKHHIPKDIIHTQIMHHLQPYAFKFHKAKLNILLKENMQFAELKNYLEKICTKDFPHHIFTYNKNKESKQQQNEQRASQLQFKHLGIKIFHTTNQSNQLAKLAMHLAHSNKQRHQAIQDFMLINDSTTIATEVPIYLTNWDAGYYRNQRGFVFPLGNYTTPITGHIDILQIRNGCIHILDYKPNADQQKPVEQLTLYALALSRKLNLQLSHFKCAWFDDKDYFEFFPLHAVYERN